MSPVYINTVSHPPRRPARTDQRTDQSRATQTPARLATGGWREILRWLFRPPSAEAQRSWRRLSEIARLAAFPTGMSRVSIMSHDLVLRTFSGRRKRCTSFPLHLAS
ncbi:uncharacterized protein CIMG_10107 [Coccidioides immitis RS]|uniref:Uncharacterized protein n=1 Tax=Coccidioides immitis (strain RS) TaxID=246410 RepID=J3K0U2_COCIM|nr:uncharacterized protein CIMG_10107 [Coccidioides immitis RS]EAS27502.3 hypothetical protein CIMG_10107 [Coccidioides immitis RS]